MMIRRLFEKELRNHLLDFRSIAVFFLVVALSLLSVTVGTRNYIRDNRESSAARETNRNYMQQSLVKDTRLWDLKARGYSWNSTPQALSPIVFGLTGVLGREAHLHYQRHVRFNDSLQAVDPLHALFGTLDFAFVVKIVMSFCVLLLTYDAVCGEKRDGTLRLAASCSISRGELAVGKLLGSGVAVLLPLLFIFVLVSATIALTPDLSLSVDGWIRLACLMVIFTLYLSVFVSFGIWVSALSSRPMTAFVGLLGLWIAWVFLLPNLALTAAQKMYPVESTYVIKKTIQDTRWDAREGREEETEALEEREGRWWELEGAQRAEFHGKVRRIRDKWDARFHTRSQELQASRRNQERRQISALKVLSTISPLGALTFSCMDLAQTGFPQKDRLENALNTYLPYMDGYIQEHWGDEDEDYSDFVWFDHKDRESVGAVLIRNIPEILNLALLALVGIAGAYVAILRYDVR